MGCASIGPTMTCCQGVGQAAERGLLLSYKTAIARAPRESGVLRRIAQAV